MDDTIEQETSSIDNKNPTTNTNDDGSQYIDCIRLVEGGHTRRFENVVAKFDVAQYELNDGDDGPTKPLLFYAIEHNDETFVKVLLEMEVLLNKSYTVSRRIREIHMTLEKSFVTESNVYHFIVCDIEEYLIYILK